MAKLFVWESSSAGPKASGMATLRDIHQFMSSRVFVALQDGRTGKIVRVDTVFPDNDTTVTIWTDSDGQPGVAKVHLDQVVGAAVGKAG